MHPLAVVTAVIGLVVWASHASLHLTLAGQVYVLPVLVLVAALMVLLLVAMIALIVRSLLRPDYVTRLGTG